MVDRPKEEVAFEPENLDILGQARQRAVVITLSSCCDTFGDHGFTRTPDEEEARQQNAGLDRDNQIDKDRQQEGDQHDRCVAARTAEHVDEAVPLAHVVGDDRHNAAQGGQRNQRGETSKTKHDQDEDHCMDDARDGRHAPVLDVGRRACDGARRRNAAEKRRTEIGHALRDEFGVGVVALAGHAVRDDGGEERFYPREKGDRDGWGHHGTEGLVRTGRPVRHRDAHALGDLRETVADGLDDIGCQTAVMAEHGDQQRCDKDRDQRAGNLGGDPLPKDADENGTDAEGDIIRADGVDVVVVRLDLLDEVRRHLLNVKPENIFELACKNDQRDAGGEADRDRIGDVFDDRAKAERTHEDEHNTGHKGRDGQAVISVLLDDTIDDDDEGACGAADLDPASAEEGNKEAGNNSRDKSLLG